jgi:hypothetical protein
LVGGLVIIVYASVKTSVLVVDEVADAATAAIRLRGDIVELGVLRTSREALAPPCGPPKEGIRGPDGRALPETRAFSTCLRP